MVKRPNYKRYSESEKKQMALKVWNIYERHKFNITLKEISVKLNYNERFVGRVITEKLRKDPK